jgi:DNA-binding transcriptional regulator YiaG
MLWQTKSNRLVCDNCLADLGIFSGRGKPSLTSDKCATCEKPAEGLGASLLTARNWANHSRTEAAKWIGCTRERVQEWEAADATPNADSVGRIMGYIRAFGKARF